MINRDDLNELKRLSTNCYDEDKKIMNRIIHGITNMEREIQALRAEVESLKKK